MVEVHFTIFGEPRTKKNSQRVVMRGRYPKILQSEAYIAYEKLARPQCPELGINGPVNVKAHYYRSTRRRVDITNLEGALLDILVKAGTLSDDNCNIVVSTDGSRVFCDRNNPRTEVTITTTKSTFQEVKK